MATLEAPSGRAPAYMQDHLSPSRFTISATKKMPAACAPRSRKVRGQLGREYDLIIGGKRVKTTDKIKSLNPAQALADRRHPSEGRQRSRRARDAGCAQGIRNLEPHHRRRARQPAVPRRRPDAPAQDGIHGVAGLRSRQELGRGRRRHLRDDRLLRVLRARGAAACEGRDAHAVARRARSRCTTFRSAWAP